MSGGPSPYLYGDLPKIAAFTMHLWVKWMIAALAFGAVMGVLLA